MLKEIKDADNLNILKYDSIFVWDPCGGIPHLCYRVFNLLANMQPYRPLPEAVRLRKKFYEAVRLRTKFYEAVRLRTKFNQSKIGLPYSDCVRKYSVLCDLTDDQKKALEDGFCGGKLSKRFFKGQGN